MAIIVDPEGKVAQVRVVKPIDLLLNKSAVDTVRTWKFRPATENGKPVTRQVTIDITFRSF